MSSADGRSSRSARPRAKAPRKEGSVSSSVVGQLRGWYGAQGSRWSEEADRLAGDDKRQEKLLEGALAMAVTEREALRHAARAGVIADEVATLLIRELDDRVLRLKEADHEGGEAVEAVLEDVLGT